MNGVFKQIMMEMTLLTKIVIFIAFVLLCAGGILYRRQARELARKNEELKNQKFKNKQARIIEELTSGQRPHTKSRNAPQNQPIPNHSGPNHPNLSNPQPAGMPPVTSVQQAPEPEHKLQTPPETPATPQQGTSDEAARQPTFIVTPAQAPPLEPTTIINPIRTKEFTSVAGPEKANSAGQTRSEYAEESYHQQHISEAGAGSLNDHSLPKIITNHTQIIGEAPLPEAVPQQSLLKSAFSSFTRKPNEPAALNLQRRRGNAVSNELKLNAEDNLYKHINDYAKWLVSQSPKFVIEHYEDGVPQENIPLIMDAEQLERKNGHWIDLFRPIDLLTTLKAHEGPSSALYCPFTSQSVDQLKKPALQILADVENEASPRYELVIKECALNEFVTFLDDLKNITA